MLIGDDVHSVFLMLLIGTDALQWLISSPSLSLALSLRFISFALPASFLLMAYWLIDVPDVFFFFLLPSPCNEISKFYSYSILRTGLHFRAVFRTNTLFKTYDRWP